MKRLLSLLLAVLLCASPVYARAAGNSLVYLLTYALVGQARNTEDVDKAISLCERAAKAAPGDIDLLYECGAALYEHGAYEHALGYFEQALPLCGPEDQEAILSWIDMCLWQIADTQRIIDVLAAHEALLVALPDTHVSFLDSLLSVDEAAALAYVDDFERRNPQDAYALLIQGYAYGSACAWDTARALFDQARQADDDYAWPATYFRYLLEHQCGEFVAADRVINQLLRMGGSDDNALWMLRIELLMDYRYDYENGLTMLEAQLRAVPGDFMLLYYKAGAQALLGDDAAWRATCDEIEAFHGATYADFVRASCLYSLDLLNEALASISAAIERDDDVLSAMLLHTMEALILSGQGAFEAAHAALAQVPREETRNTMYMRALASLYSYEGRQAEAARAYDSAYYYADYSSFAVLQLALLAHWGGFEEDAQDILASMARLYPYHFETLYAAYSYAVLTGDLPAARRAFDTLLARFPALAADLDVEHAFLLAREGAAEAAQAQLTHALTLAHTAAHFASTAQTAALLGDFTLAASCLSRAAGLVETHDTVDNRAMLAHARALLCVMQGDAAAAIAHIEESLANGMLIEFYAQYDLFAPLWENAAFQALCETHRSDFSDWDLSRWPALP